MRRLWGDRLCRLEQFINGNIESSGETESHLCRNAQLANLIIGNHHLNHADAPGQLSLAVAAQLAEVSQAPSEGAVQCLRRISVSVARERHNHAECKSHVRILLTVKVNHFTLCTKLNREKSLDKVFGKRPKTRKSEVQGMGRIPEEEKARLKREVSIQRLAEARGVKLKRSGKELIGLCPFHEDRNPSLCIDPAQNVWHCKGACGKGGDVIEWVMRAEGVSFRHAVELLRREHLPLAARLGGPPPKESTTVKLPPLAEHSLDDNKLLEAVVQHYHEALKQSPEAQQYLIKRGLGSAEMIDYFHLGFANRTLNYRVPDKNRKQGEEQHRQLERLGILRGSGHEHFNGSVVIPVFNLKGEVVEMYGRKITRLSALREGTEAHAYLRGPLRGVWNEQAFIASKEIILCEALIDALTFWCAGFRHVTASYGVNGFTDDHRVAFQKHGTKRIYIAYDRDDAGERAAQSLAEELLATGIECFRVQFPKNMDANEYALKVTPATKSLGMLLGKAAWLGKGQRPTVGVSEPRIEAQPAIEEKIEPAAKEEIPAAATTPAAKEKISETIEANTNEESVAAIEEQADFSLAAEPPIASLPTGTVVPVRDVPVEVSGETVYVSLGERRYRILGLAKNTAPGVLRVNVMVTGTNTRGEMRLQGRYSPSKRRRSWATRKRASSANSPRWS
jgi:DNA primase catalytic core